MLTKYSQTALMAVIMLFSINITYAQSSSMPGGGASSGGSSSQPAEPGRFVDCDYVEEALEDIELFINKQCNGGMGPFEPDVIDLCIEALNARDYLQNLYDQNCTSIAIQK